MGDRWLWRLNGNEMITLDARLESVLVLWQARKMYSDSVDATVVSTAHNVLNELGLVMKACTRAIA